MAGQSGQVTLDHDEWTMVARALGWCLSDDHFTLPNQRMMAKAQREILKVVDKGRG